MTHQVEYHAPPPDGSGKLRPRGWKSGAWLRVVELIGPFGGVDEMIKDLKLKVYPGRTIHERAVKACIETVMVV